jgi:hypothetical protein
MYLEEGVLTMKKIIFIIITIIFMISSSSPLYASTIYYNRAIDHSSKIPQPGLQYKGSCVGWSVYYTLNFYNTSYRTYTPDYIYKQSKQNKEGIYTEDALKFLVKNLVINRYSSTYAKGNIEQIKKQLI